MQSRVFSVGNGVLWGEAEVGMVATQAIVDVSYGPQALQLLKSGLTPAAIVKAIWDDDPDPGLGKNPWPKAGRQFAVMDAKGNYAAFTGPKATPWAGNKGGKFCTAQGNILAGEAVVAGMVDAFEKTTGSLSLRLMAALDAGQAAGGDTRGMQSAAMLIVKKNGGVWLHNDVVLRLQVDDSPSRSKSCAASSRCTRSGSAPGRGGSRPPYFVFRSVRVTRPSPPDSGSTHNRSNDVVARRQRGDREDSAHDEAVGILGAGARRRRLQQRRAVGRGRELQLER